MRLLGLLLLTAASALAAATPEYRVEVIRVFPHDPTAFTQGFEFRAGKLYEGTGLNGRSSVRIEDLQTGRVLKQIDLPSQFFGEGITVLKGKIIETTWLTQTGFIYRQSNLARIGEFHYSGQGWGLANDGRHVYFSDGTSAIRVLNSQSLAEERRIKVQDNGKPIDMLNELEFIRGEIWANIWQTDRIVRISPQDGKVLGWIDAGGLLNPADTATRNVDVLNGIAYDAAKKRIFLTGKLWPKIFEVRIVPKSAK